MAGPIRIAILGNASSALGAIRATDTATSRLGSRFKSVALAAAKFAAAGAALSVGLAGYAAVNFAQAAANDAQQAAILARVLTQAAGASRSQIAANEDWIASMGRSLGIADDDLRPALAKLAAATGSVAKAQRLSALAADVAAGRNKDLGTVTEALAKAQSGNLGGLGRLGVATKDAAGKTKTLQAITADLAKTYKGAASTSAETAAGKFARMKLALSETAEAIGYKLLPLVTDVGNYLLNRGIPAVDKLAEQAESKLGPAIADLSDWFKDNKANLEDLGREFLGTAIPALKTTADVVGSLIGFFAGLPGPVQTFGLQIAAAALILPRLNAALAISGGAMTRFVGNVRNAETRMVALRGAAGAAAGVGGLVALTAAAGQSNGALKTLMNVAGGAALGFSMGGPWGALIGGAGGGLITALQATSNATDQTKGSFEIASPVAGDYADQLNRISGAATAASRNTAALALQQSGAIEAGRNLGLSSRDLVKYVLGNAAAVRKVDRAINSATAETSFWIDQFGGFHQAVDVSTLDAGKLSTALNRNASAFNKSKGEAQELALANGALSKALKDVDGHSKIVAKIERVGFPETVSELAAIIGKQDLARKDVQTLITTLGVPTTVADLERVRAGIAALHDKTIKITTVNVNGHSASTVEPHSSNPVDQKTAGRKQAKDFLEGLVAGFQGTEGITTGIDKVTAYIDDRFKAKFAKIREQLNKTLDGKALDKAMDKAEKRLDKQQSKILKGLRDQEKALRLIGRAQDANNQALENAKAALAQIQETAAAYAASIRDSVIEFGNLTQLGGEAGFGSAEQLIALLKSKAEQAQQFANIIDALRASGLSETAIQQLINAGVEGGIGTAQAILSGGPAAIAQINTLQAQLSAAGTQLGGNAAQSMYGAGIQAAQGLVDGLAANADALAAQATKLAKALVRAVKKALGINSPSRVFREIGKFTVRGLSLGLDVDKVRAQGVTLGRALERGFGSPSLEAMIAARADAQRSSVEVRLTAQQMDALSRGKAIQADLDTYYANGGRRT